MTFRPPAAVRYLPSCGGSLLVVRRERTLLRAYLVKAFDCSILYEVIWALSLTKSSFFFTRSVVSIARCLACKSSMRDSMSATAVAVPTQTEPHAHQYVCMYVCRDCMYTNITVCRDRSSCALQNVSETRALSLSVEQQPLQQDDGASDSVCGRVHQALRH